jgi:hypothetical protein
MTGRSATISHFAVCVEDDAPGAWVGGFNATSCQSGVLLKGANNSIFYNYAANGNVFDGTDVVSTNGAELLNTTTNNNQVFGVLFTGSSHNVLDFFVSQFNGESNVRVSPLPPPAPPPRLRPTPSTFNIIEDSSLRGSNLSVVIDKTSSNNIITDMGINLAQPASSLDLFDKNPGCDRNLWFLNGFVNAKPVCTKGPK